MENFILKEKIPVKIEKRECIEFVNPIKNNVLDNFPFESEEQMDNFVSEIDSVLGDDESVYNSNIFIDKLSEALDSLKNSHTRLRKKNKFKNTHEEITPEEKSRKLVKSYMLDEDIGYLRVDGWYDYKSSGGKNVGDLAEEGLKNLDKAKYLIIDVRNNTGGNSNFAQKLAEHFIEKEVPFVTIWRREGKTLELTPKEASIRPRGEFIDKKIVILTGPKCFSSNELFILMLKDTGRAITVGQKTGGGSGCPKTFELKFNGEEYFLDVSTWRLRRLNGSDLEGVGIEPDIEVEEEKQGDKDPVLDRAIEYFKENGE